MHAPARTVTRTAPAHRTRREHLPPFILGLLTFLVAYAAVLLWPFLPAVLAPVVGAGLLTGPVLWAYVGATWRPR